MVCHHWCHTIPQCEFTSRGEEDSCLLLRTEDGRKAERLQADVGTNIKTLPGEAELSITIDGEEWLRCNQEMK